MIVYYNGQYLEKERVAISPDDRGFLFADGVYEVLRSYQGHLFRCAEHLKRLEFGLEELRMEGCRVKELGPVMYQLLHTNNLAQPDATVYVQVTRGSAPRNHRFPPRGTAPTVYAEAKAFTPPTQLQERGISAIVVADQRWARCDIKTVGLLAHTLACQRAEEAGAFEAIFSRDGVLLEGTRASILFVKDGNLVCPPLTNYVLPSVTRTVVLDVAAAEGIAANVRPCFEPELASFDEILMVGTTAEIIPIVSVGGVSIGNGQPGRLTRRLQTAFRKVVAAERAASSRAYGSGV
jgi:D-alanine transaminase